MPAHDFGRFGCLPSPPDPRRLTVRLAAGRTGPRARRASYSAGWTYQLARNNVFGTCVPAALSNSMAQSLRLLAGVEFSPDAHWPDQLDAYRKGGSPLFDPTTGAGDRGSSPAAVLQAALSPGFISPNRLLGYASLADVAPGGVTVDPDKLAAVVEDWGGAMLGFTVTDLNARQRITFEYNDAPLVASHCVLVTGYDLDADRFEVVSWKTRMGLTGEMVRRRAFECWLPLWPWHVTSGNYFDANTNLVQLAADFAAVTGRPFPYPVPDPLPFDPARPGTFAYDERSRRVVLAPGPGWSEVRGAAALTGGVVEVNYGRRVVYLP